MMRALFSGVTGLRTHQTKMDVIGNNIANVNTLGYKKSAANFADLYSETVAPASAPTANQGGVNARQIGLGVTCNSIVIKHTAGAAQYTGNTLDLAISGDGFFTVRTGEGERYTRAGNLSVSSNGSLVTPSGFYVQCFNSIYRQGDAGTITGSSGISNAATTGFQEYTFTPNTTAVNTAGSGTYTYEINDNNKVDVYKNGILQQSDLEILDMNDNSAATTGFQPNTDYRISTALGDITFTTSSHAITSTPGFGQSTANVRNLTLTPTDASTAKVAEATAGTYNLEFVAPSSVTITDGTTTETVAITNAANQAVTVLSTQPAAGEVGLVPGEVYTVKSTFGDISFSISNPVENNTTDLTSEVETLINQASFTVSAPATEGIDNLGTALSFLDTLLQNTSITISNNDGFTSGATVSDMVIDQDTYENVTINEEGAVIAQLKSAGTPPGITGAIEMAQGEKVILGYLALANFTNTEGLEKVATNLYASTSNSGRVTYHLAGSGGTGMITPSSLEMSNVDLSEEMVNMITTQRGFQANSRIITTTDTMLEELINLKR